MTLNELKKIIKKLNGKLYLVGGAVRDRLMNQTPKDYDYLVTGIEVDDMPFNKVAGSDFPVFIIDVDGEETEIALARAEKKNGVGYHGFEFNTNKNITVEEDLLRRDITINAIAIDMDTDEIIDPFNGKKDIENKVIRHVSDAFKDDPTRVYRVARFAARFGFDVAPETMQLIKSMKDELKDITPERVGKELEKVMTCKNPSIFFKVLKDTDLLDIHFKAVADLDVPDRHDGTAFNHTMTVMDAGRDAMDRFALLCHDFGKGATPKNQHPRHFHHDKLGVDVVKSFCDSLRIPNSLKKVAVSACVSHMKAKLILDMKASTLVKFVVDCKDIDDVIRVSRVDSIARDGADVDAQKALFDKISDRVAKVKDVFAKVTGKSLIAAGHKPGKDFGDKLHQARVSAFKKL